MITQEENDRFTQVGPGTPMGSLMRRYWQALAPVADLDTDPVRPVRLLGEDLVLFRSERGDLGLIAHRCAHRNMALSYGIPQVNGLRCAYHGWTYDTEGHVVDMPFESSCLPLKIAAYPVQELGGIVWAYMGPAPAPLLPRWDSLVAHGFNRDIKVTPLNCNWLQCMDNSLDPVHFEHLHGVFGNYTMQKMGRPPMLIPARHVKIEFDVFEYGIYKRRLLEGQTEESTDWTIGHPILFPNTLAQGGAGSMSFQIRVPTDDTHTMHIVVNAREPAPGDPLIEEVPVVHEPVEYDDAGRVLPPYIVKQDEAAWIGQGTVTNRATEHLVTSDRGILLYRKLLIENMEKVERGEDPMGLIRDEDLNYPMVQIRRGSTYAAFRDGMKPEDYGGVRNGAPFYPHFGATAVAEKE